MIKYVTPAPTVTLYQVVENALVTEKMMDTVHPQSILRLVAVVEMVANGLQDREHLKAALEAFAKGITCWDDGEEGPEESVAA